MAKFSKPTKEVLEDINSAWLKSNRDNEHFLINPLEVLKVESPEDFEKRLAWLLMQPEYFGFLCKQIFNVELLPMQAMVLKEMWNRKFPMLIATRGWGKAARLTEKVRVKEGWKEIGQLQVGDMVYGGDGKLTKVTYVTGPQKDLNFYRVTLRDGRSIEVCEDHLWKVWDKNKNRKTKTPYYSVMSTKEMVLDYCWDRKDSKSKDPDKRTTEYRYALPINNCLLEEEEKSLPIHPYVLGVILGDGGITTKNITITSTDEEIIQNVRERLPSGYKIEKIPSAEYGYSITMDGAEFPFWVLLEFLGLRGHKSEHKFIPDMYKYASSNQRLELLQGLMDTDGTSTHKEIQYYTSSSQLADDVCDLMRSLGLHIRRSIKPSYIGDIRYLDCHRVSVFTDKPLFKLIRKLTYLNHTKSKAGQSRYEKVFITKIEPIGKQDGCCITVDNEDSTYLINDYIVTHNTWLLSLYCMLRALLMPGRKIVVAGAAFRQSKFLHEYMVNIWKNAPVLRDICDQDSGPSTQVDMCRMSISGSIINAIPIGTGEKIRGLRANDIISDEFACLRRKSLVQTDLGLISIQDYLDGAPYSLMNMDGKFEYPDTIFRTKPVDVYRITTTYGYKIECSEIHQVLTNSGWKKTLELTDKDYIKLGHNDYFPPKYIDGLDPQMGWLLGILVSEGCVTNRNQFSVHNTDRRLIDKIKTLPYEWKESYKAAYKDGRGWDCKESWTLTCSNTEVRTQMKDFGLDYDIAINKKIPKSILMSPKDVVISFLSGMYEGDGSAFICSPAGRKKELQVVLYSSSHELLETTQILLLKFGIMAAIGERTSKLSDNAAYRLVTRGGHANKLYQMLDVIKWDLDLSEFTFKEERKPQIRKNGERFIVSTNVCNKNKHLGTYDSEEECVAAFDKFWESNTEFVKVDKVEKLDEQEVLYDFHMPETHSFIANGFVQHNSSSRDIFENVIAGFGMVSSTPTENVRREAAKKRAVELGYDPSFLDVGISAAQANQIIISGTAYYDFNHFAEYWKKWKAIVQSKGNKKKLEEIFMGEVPDAFNWKDYSVIRIPWDLVPKGFLDESQIARSKATVHTGIFLMEYSACFATDSKGFFKRSLIESCVGTDVKPIQTPSGPIYFDPMIKGNPTKKYIMGVDPASEVDNFSICIVELNSDHRKVVHCWTTNRKDQIQRVKLGLTTEDNFYSYCARRIRDLMGLFNVVHIAIDSQGGGIPVSEALHDSTQLKPGEIAIWPIIEEGKEKPSDDEAGLHIIELCHFANADWIGEANHGLRKDFEDKVLLLPRFDAVSLGISSEQDAVHNRLFDTLEDCVIEIEELKNELSLIEISKTPTGRDRWDTPEVKTGAGKKKRLRKDRYSSLLMANMAARNFKGAEIQKQYVSYGGFASVSNINKDEPDYIGPNWFTSAMKDVY